MSLTIAAYTRPLPGNILVDETLIVRKPDVGVDVNVAPALIHCLEEHRMGTGHELDVQAEVVLDDSFEHIRHHLGVSPVGLTDDDGLRRMGRGPRHDKDHRQQG